GGRVVPRRRHVSVLVELLRDHADLAGLDIDLDERFLGRLRHPLVRGDQGVGERLEHDLFGNALFDRERRERFEHLGVLHVFPFARARPRSLDRRRGCGPHSNTARAWVTSEIAISSSTPSSVSTTQSPPPHARITPRPPPRPAPVATLTRNPPS